MFAAEYEPGPEGLFDRGRLMRQHPSQYQLPCWFHQLGQ